MLKSLKILPVVLLCAACVYGDDLASSGNVTSSGSGVTSKGEPIRGLVTTKSDGRTRVVSVTLPSNAVCTTVFDELRDKESSPLNCTDGKNGTAVMRLNLEAGTPKAIAYFRGTESGPLTF